MVSGTGHQHGTYRPNSLIASLSRTSAEALLAAGVAKGYPAGAVLLAEGTTSTHVVVLLDGYAKVTATNTDGGVALLAIRSGGDLVGELAALDGQPRSATVTAASAVQARIISQTDFHHLLSRHPELAEEVSRTVVAKLRWATRRRTDFSGCSVAVRVAHVLLELAVIHGAPTADGLEIAFPLSQPELAALVGAAEPTVHKVLADLRRKQIVGTGYRSMTIRDLTALRAFAGLPTA